MPAHRPQSLFLLTHEFFPTRGGIATFTEEMALAGSQLGYDVEVWAQERAGTHAEKNWPFRVKRLPLPGTHDFSCQARLMGSLISERRRLRYATVYLPEPGPMLAMMLLQHFRAFRPKRLMLTFHGSEILRFHRNPAYRLLAGKLIAEASRISTLSNFTRDLLCEKFPMARGKVLLTPGALRSGFAESAPPPQGKPAGRLVVLTVARLHPRKGQLDTLRALQALPSRLRGQVEYWIVGGNSKGGYAERLRAEAAKMRMTVRFFGDVSDEELDQLYDKADLFSMTSVDHGSSIEGFGLVYLEAGAHGLPVVAHAIGGVPEAVADGRTGLLVNPGDQGGLTEAFRRLLEDPQARRQLGEAGRLRARAHTWTESARILFSGGGAGA